MSFYVSVLEHDQWRRMTNHEFTNLFGGSDILTEVEDAGIQKKALVISMSFMIYAMKNGVLSK